MTQEASTLTNLELQIESVDREMIDLMTVNEQARSHCHNIIRNLQGIGGVAKLVHNCHESAQAIQNFEAELAALNGEELMLKEETAALKRELENAVKCMETLLLDVQPTKQQFSANSSLSPSSSRRR